MHKDICGIIMSEDEIKQTVEDIAARINNDYKDKSITAICILKGAVVFFSDLVRKLDMDVRLDFMLVSSYGASTESTGQVKIIKDLDESIHDRHVIIVEDIVDSGLTLSYLLNILKERKPASIKICCLMDKPSRRKADIEVDYAGTEIPDAFAVGYGLDYAERYRNLPYIGELKKEIYSK